MAKKILVVAAALLGPLLLSDAAKSETVEQFLKRNVNYNTVSDFDRNGGCLSIVGPGNGPRLYLSGPQILEALKQAKQNATEVSVNDFDLKWHKDQGGFVAVGYTYDVTFVGNGQRYKVLGDVVGILEKVNDSFRLVYCAQKETYK